MPLFLGVDTSNYTTSAALYDSVTDEVLSQRMLLPVPQGGVGLRQSDALFSHIKQLPEVFSRLFAGRSSALAGVCVSNRPRAVQGSYMPVFLAGVSAASAVASSTGAAYFTCTHQQGHIVAALYSAGARELLKQEFYAFHVSGGTTECLLVRPETPLFSAETAARTLDLNAGQLVDRVGVMLGMGFPCGPELDELSLRWEGGARPRPSFQGTDCHFSGAENQCAKLLEQGAPPEQAARFAIEYIRAAVDGMTERVLQSYGEKPILYAGGVMSNSLIRAALEKKFNGRFAAPEFSSDNAAGAAIIGAMLFHANTV